MASMKYVVAFLAVALTVAVCSPVPGFGPKHEHVIIHVPYKVHTVHHHHVKKVLVPYPVEKKVIVYDSHHGYGGGWW